MAKLNHLNTPALEVLVDIARTIGERRYVSGGDSRDDWRDMCEWADEFQARFELNPDAGETYMEDVEQFAIEKAVDAGWSVCEAIDSDHAIKSILSADGTANDGFDVREERKLTEVPNISSIKSLALHCSGSEDEQTKTKFAALVGMFPDRFCDEVDGGHSTMLAKKLAERFTGAQGAAMLTELKAFSSEKEGEMMPIKMPIVFGKNRTRGNSVGAMIDDMYGEHTELRNLLAKEARGQGVDPSADWLTNAVAGLLRLYEQSHDAWVSSKGETIGHVYEAELPSGAKLLMGSRQILSQIDEVRIDEGANISQERVVELPRLQQQAGAAYTLYQIASKALQEASGDAKAVDWGQVHQDVFAKAVGQDKQPVASVLETIRLHSPGAITPEQIAAVEAMGESGELTTRTMKPGEWGTKDGKPAITWWRHGQAAKGEPSIVTEVRTYATEVERVDAASQSARDSTAATLVQLAASLGKWAAVKNDSVDAKLREFNEAFDVADLRLTAVELAQKVFLQNPEHDGSKKISLPPAFLEDMSRILAPSQMKSRDDGPAP